MKLNIVVYDEQSEVFNSTIHRDVVSDFEMSFRDGYDEECKQLPYFTVKWFYKKLVGWFEYQGDYHIFVSKNISQHELGRVEHCIYAMTGLRGVGNYINKIEFLASPNVPLKKFLMKRI